NKPLRYCDLYDFLPSIVAVAFAVGLAISGCRRGSSLIRVASLLCLLFSLGLIAIAVYAMIDMLLR
ncbi:MAG: hypothetical protein GX616_25085, partial [Planctomycetes bacterium]|nr:hypothetical protein [Planctomycetota bacterium]